MSDLAPRRARLERTRPRAAVVACFCDHCSRPLYVAEAEAEVLFCPVCSSTVSRIAAAAEDEHVTQQDVVNR